MLKLLACAVLLRSVALADGGRLQFRAETRDLTATVFTAPMSLTAGPVDLSVLVQTREGLQPVLDAEVSVQARALGSGNLVRGRATHDQAWNKLLYAVPLTLAESGKWRIEVTIQRAGVQSSAAGIVDVVPRRAMIASYWAYVAYPPLVILLFLLHECLVRRKRLSGEFSRANAELVKLQVRKLGVGRTQTKKPAPNSSV